MTLRRQFDLLPDDRQFLEEYGLPWETIVDGSQWVLIHDFPTHQGYNHPRVTAAVRIETGYPTTELNMVYFFPAVRRKDSRPIGATEAMQPLDGKDFQRWSRHRTGTTVEDRPRQSRHAHHLGRGLAGAGVRQMPSRVTLALSGDQHEHLKSFLFPGDGKEAAAVLLCGRRDGDRRHRLTVREIHGVPYELCPVRTPMQVTWPPDYIAPMLERAAAEGLSVVKVHSHPTGYAAFSQTDDEGDARLLPMIRGWIEADIPHGSAVMLPDGQMFGRIVRAGAAFESIECISIAGNDLLFWYADSGSVDLPDFTASHLQAFDEGTIQRLRRLWIAVIGASGTGSPVVEQLLRLGVGVLVIVDDDRMEGRNVNRILNSTMLDVRERRFKVDVLGDAAERTELGTEVLRVAKNLWHPDVIRTVAQCDVVFGCMDTVDGRYLLNALASYYTIPYFDIGIRLDAVRDGANRGRIREVCGTVNYLRPGRSSLVSRGLFTMADVAAAGLRRNDPAAHARQVKDGYIKGVPASRPAVISVNMFGASLAVNEFLARLHPFREESNDSYGSVIFSLASMEIITEPEEGICEILGSRVGTGDTTPLLGLMELAERRAA